MSVYLARRPRPLACAVCKAPIAATAMKDQAPPAAAAAEFLALPKGCWFGFVRKATELEPDVDVVVACSFRCAFKIAKGKA